MEKFSSKIRLVFLVLLSCIFVAATASAQVYAPVTTTTTYVSYGAGIADINTEEFCREGQDFIIQVPPGACQPAVVRSDLLEEQPVPVYCNLLGVKVNPLIDIPYIQSISAVGFEASKDITNIGYYPARYGITFGAVPTVAPATLGNLGWVIVWLKQQPVEKEMPDYVEANLTARIRYDVMQSFGIGRRDFILQEVSDEYFERHAGLYSFWRGKGYVRAVNIQEDGADIEVYDSRRAVPQTLHLKTGDAESSPVYLPGFYCSAGVVLKLESISYPSVKAKMLINGNESILGKDSTLTEFSECKISSIEPGIAGGLVKISCLQNQYTLSLESRSASINTKEIKVGSAINETDKVYLAYIGREKIEKAEKDFVIAIKVDSTKELTYFIKAVEIETSALLEKGSIFGKEKTLLDELHKETKLGAIKNITIVGSEESKTIGKTAVKLGNVEGLKSITLPSDIKEDYDDAIQAYEAVADDYTYIKSGGDQYGDYLGLQALKEAANLAEQLGQTAEQEKLLEKIVELYEKENITEEEQELENLRKNSRTEASANFFDQRTGESITVILEEIIEPTRDDINARILVNGAEKNVARGEMISDNFTISDITDKEIVVQYTDKEGKVQEVKISANSKKTLESTIIEVKNVYAKKEAKVKVIPFSRRGETLANFSIKIGIEKRAIQLTPEQIIHQINESAKLSEQVDKLVQTFGKIVETGKIACLTTQVALAVKNLVSPQAIARRNVMRGFDEKTGWTAFCNSKVLSPGAEAKKEQQVGVDVFRSIDHCYSKFAPQIEADVKRVNNALASSETIIKDVCKNMKEDKCAEALAKKIPELSALGNANITALIANNKLGKESAKQLLLLQETRKQCNGPVTGVAFSVCNKVGDIQSAGGILAKEIETLKKASEGVGVISQLMQETGIARDIQEKLGPITETLSEKPLPEISRPVVKDPKYGFITAVNVQGIGPLILGLRKEGEIYYPVTYLRNKEMIIIKDPKDTDEQKKNDWLTAVKIIPKSWNSFTKAPQVSFWESGKWTGLPYVIPFEYEKNGFYVLMKRESYDDSGAPNYIAIYNVGENGEIDFGKGDDVPYDELMVSQISTLEGEKKAINEKALSLVRSVAGQYQSSKLTGAVTVGDKVYKMGRAAVDVLDIQCQDFMSAADCKILFNVCDPVMCPSSRCDLGGRYTVSNVVQTGIFGSLALCMHNFVGFGGDVFVPVCVSGIYAGLQNINTELKAYQACMQESLDTGKTVGICDELRSIFYCDFIWREAVPILSAGIPNIITKIFGGGGEYLPFKATLDAFTNNLKYFTTVYAENAFNAFKIRSTAEAGTEVCRQAFSLRYPDSAELLGRLTEPESPPQFSANFDEIPYSTATYPPTSQYKVYYHLYAGEDKGVTYSIYLANPEFAGGVSPFVPIAYGYLPQGQYLDETKDFTQASGYRELCVEIDLQRECGFGKVSTSYLPDYLSGQYLKQQIEAEIDSAEECISGTASLMPLISGFSLNPQEMVTESINPSIYSRGINRICSSNNPGKGVNEARWNFVGWCDKEKGLGCWLDTDSVEGAIKDLGILNETLENANKLAVDYLIKEEGYYSETDARDKLKEAKDAFEAAKTADSIKDAILKFKDVFEKGIFIDIKAEAQLYIGRAYKALAEKAAPAAPAEGEKKVPAVKAECVLKNAKWLIDPNAKFVKGTKASLAAYGEGDCDGLTVKFDVKKVEKPLGIVATGSKEAGDPQPAVFSKNNIAETTWTTEYEPSSMQLLTNEENYFFFALLGEKYARSDEPDLKVKPFL